MYLPSKTRRRIALAALSFSLVAGGLLVGTFFAPPIKQALAQAGLPIQLDKRAAQGKLGFGWYSIDFADTGWHDIRPRDLFKLSGGTPFTTSDFYVEFSLINDEAAGSGNILYVLGRANNGEAITVAYPLGPQEKLNIDDLIWAGGTTNGRTYDQITHLSVQGSVANVSARLLASVSRNATE